MIWANSSKNPWIVAMTLCAVGLCMYSLIGFCCFVATLNSVSGVESDVDTRKIFHEHKQKFEQLRSMLLYDSKLERVASRFISYEGPKLSVFLNDPLKNEASAEELSKAGISPSRLTEYFRLMRAVGVFEIDINRFDGSISFGIGQFSSGTKYIYYRHQGIPQNSVLVADTASKRISGFFCSQIEKDWYIYREISGSERTD